MKKILFSSLFVLALVAGAVAQPTGPHIFSGEADVNGTSVADGTVTARADGGVVGSADINDGIYDDLLVQGIENQTLVKFYIDGLDTNENHTYRPWNVTELNLSAELESSKNYSVSEVKDNVSSGDTVSVKAPDEASTSSGAVDELNITVNKDTDSVEVNVTVTDKKTTDEVNENVIEDVDDGDTEVEGVIDVESNVENEDIGDTSIGFTLKKSKIDNEPESVVLIHFEDGSRVGVLDTTYLEDKTEKKDDGFYHYRAKTDSFSSYAMTSDSTKPEADAGSDKTVLEDLEADFDASGSTDNVEIKNYTWDFDDGDTATGEEVSHEFDSGTYDVELTVYDTAGNKDTDTITVDVDPVSDEDTGGKGGATGQDDPEDDQSDEKSKPKHVDAVTTNGRGAVGLVGSVSEDQEVRVELPDAASDTAVKAVSFTSRSSAEDVEVSVRGLEGKPEGLPDAATRVHSYQEINLSGLSDSEVEGVSFNFTVEKDFIDENDATTGDVVMKRYSDAGWDSVETVMREDMGDTYSFEASSSGFSYYAVSLREEDETQQEQDGLDQNQTQQNETTPRDEEEDKDGKGDLNLMIIGLVILLGLLAALVYYFREELFGEESSTQSEDGSDDSKMEYTCDECGASFDSERGLHIHQGEVHKSDED
jgi:PGF-pre-PGF domain-containing protein